MALPGLRQLAAILRHTAAAFGYDAASDRKRRRPPVSRLQTEDDELTKAQRGALVTDARDLPRNFSVAAWAVRKHLDYVSTFTFQARTPDENLNQRVEAVMRASGHKSRCDVARRHHFRRLVRLAEARRSLDGDCFLMKLADGRLQAIEGDRVASPAGEIPGTLGTLVHGVEADAAGAAQRYCVCRRTGINGLAFERFVPADDMLHVAFWDRFDQFRGVSPIASAINPLKDVYEGFEFALAKAKVAQLFALAIFNEGDTPYGATTAEKDDAGNDTGRYDVDFGRGPFKLELEPKDKAEFLESKHPSTEFQQFTAAMIAIALKSLDIPMSFFDEAYTNYSGARQALLQYEESAAQKRKDLVDDLLDPYTAWRLALHLVDGEIVLPRQMAIEDIRWEWVAAGLPWIDPLKESEADLANLSAAMTSRTRLLKRRGEEWSEVLAELKAEQAALEAAGLPTGINRGNLQITEIAGK